MKSNIKQLYISFRLLVWFGFYRLEDEKNENQTNKIGFQNSQTKPTFFIIEPIWSILVGLDHFIYFSYTLNQGLFQRKWNFTYKYDFDLSLSRMYCDSLAQLIFKSIFQKLKIKDFFE